MKFIIRGQKVEITDAIKSYIEEKIGRLEKYFNAPDSLTATVVARIRGNSQIVEVTIPTHNTILRCEVESDDLYASIDLVSDKLEPMSEEEAMLQLELLGHDFYIFKNDALNNDVCVLYKRKDGNYGIIDTK